MSLDHLQRLTLRFADGLTSRAEDEVLRLEGVDLEAERALRPLLRELLSPPRAVGLADIELADSDLADIDLADIDLADIELADAVMSALAGSDGLVDLVPGVRRQLIALIPEDPPDVADAVMSALALEDGVGAVRRALQDDLLAAGAPPELAGDVLASLHIPDASRSLGDAVRAAVSAELGDDGERSDFTDEIMAAIGHGGGSLGSLIRDACDPGPTPDLADGIMAALGASQPDLGELLREGAGAPPDLWEAIAGDLNIPVGDAAPGLAKAPDANAPDALVVPLPSSRGQTRGWRLPAAAAAAAAALLLVFTGLPGGNQIEELAYELSPSSDVEIEELASETGAMVQVFQFDEDAPPIIFVDEALEEAGLDEEGTPL